MVLSAVAGTFSVIHDGHRALISKAFEVGDSVLVGITSELMADSTHARTLPLAARMANLEEYLKTFEKPYEIMVIDSREGPQSKMDQVDILVVSEETATNGARMVFERAFRCVKPLELVVVPLVKAYDGSKISATEILRGNYSSSGKRETITVSVGSLNPVKIEAARAVMERIFGDVRITGVDVPSGVPDQPHEGATREGAVNRAAAAIGDCDYGIGIEAGVFERIDGLFDFQYCAIIDKEGRVTVGTGPGFQYPPAIASLVRAGLTVGDAMKRVFGETDIGKKQGAVGYLSKGLLDRKRLTEQAVTAAMIPRLDDSYTP